MAEKSIEIEHVPAKESAKPAEKQEEKGKGASVTLSEAELNERIAAATERAAKAEREKAQQERDAEKAKAEEAAKKAKGDLQGLLDDQVKKTNEGEAKIAELQLLVKRGDVERTLRDYITENNADYASSVKYIMPLIAYDAKTSDEDIAKRVKTAVTQFVKDNPRAASKGAPLPPPRTNNSNTADSSAKNGTEKTPGYMSRW